MASINNMSNILHKASSLILVVCIVMSLVSIASAQTTCSTGIGSPTTADVSSCVAYLQDLNNATQYCCQTTTPSSGSTCTTMCVTGTAAVDICGDYQACTTCVNAGNALNTILAGCLAYVNGAISVAGTTYASGFSFRIRHS